ncbi:hypothetical protein NDU88_007326 [Pleurodeles waltl]|uniref:Uncharacterized protein n=1 Tax=Pleurodeles waltl TaxID=8319 RepID=A0AAV7UP15_PLEWA|nr:hypothetical protein NDU88_007326 [Pleurodeles waltl]
MPEVTVCSAVDVTTIFCLFTHLLPDLQQERTYTACAAETYVRNLPRRMWTGERAPAFTSVELERLVDGVLPQYGTLYGPPRPTGEYTVSTMHGVVSAHQKKGIWRAIAKDVRTLGVYSRRSTHCRIRWEDLRRWAWKTAEAQLGMASQ